MTGPSRTAVIGDGAVRDNTGVPPVRCRPRPGPMFRSPHRSGPTN